MMLELRVLAEVNVLCTSDQAVQWVPLIDHLIQIKLTYQQDLTSGANVIHLGADIDDDTSLDLQISLTESKLKKASECFVRWKDVHSGKVWGLNFLSEEEAVEFMAFCEGFCENSSSSTSSKSLNRRSSSSLNSFSNQREISKNSKTGQNNSGQGTGTVLKSTREPSKNCGQSVDRRAGENEADIGSVEEDLCFTEFSYFKEMEIFHTAIKDEPDFQNSDKFNADCSSMNRGGSPSPAGLRKSGWLSMKHVFACGRGGRVEQTSHKKWKKYWVILKGYELNLYHCGEKDVGSIDLLNPNDVIELDGCLAQAVPEHAKLENVFGVSTRNGNAFYFQGSCQSEVEGWVANIHSASAVQFAGGRGKEQTKWLLSRELEKVRENIDSDGKLRKMAELQLTVVTDSKNKQVITDQISKWEQSLEKLSLDLYKFQCYLSAVSGTPPPNPQHVLGCASKQTKHNMSRIGPFSVITFHTLVHCRGTSKTNGNLKHASNVKRSKSSVGYSRLKSALVSSFKNTDSLAVKNIHERHSPRLPKKQMSTDADPWDNVSIVSNASDWTHIGRFLRVELTEYGSTVVLLKEDMTFKDVVFAVTKKRHLDRDMYFIMFGVEHGSHIEYYTPQEEAFVDDQNFSVLKLCKKSEYDIEMSKRTDEVDQHFGLTFTIENGRIVVSKVNEGSTSHLSGVLEGDEVLTVNNKDITDPENGLSQLCSALDEPLIILRLRSMREEVPEQIRKATESIISTLVCPPPPSTSASDIVDVAELIVPPPELSVDVNAEAETRRSSCSGLVNEEDGASVNTLLQSAEEVTSFCRQHEASREIEKQTDLSDAEKLRKIIFELLDTEKNYLKDVQTLLKRYLEPLRHESFLPTEEVNSLAENVSQILEFQSSFCSEIQQLIDFEDDFKNIKEVGLFQNVIYGIGEAFLQYADKFKLYSSFCGIHSRIIHRLQPGSNIALEEFLSARNPKQQHSSNLESYLIKPIQRILKYPLLLHEMSKLQDNNSDEYHCLHEAINAIESVAEHINEMQSITEQFLQIFHELARASGSLEVSDVDVDKLLHHKKLTWLNSPETMKANSLRWSPAPLRKVKSESTMRCFVFPKAVVLIQVERRQKKKDKAVKTHRGSQNISEEINFKTLIPMSSLILRDNSWSDQDLFNAWELVDISKNTGDYGQQETVYLLASRNYEERKETITKIKGAVRKSILEDSSNLSHRKPSTSILSTSSIHLGFPGDPTFLRRSFGFEPLRARSRYLERHHSAGDAYSVSENM